MAEKLAMTMRELGALLSEGRLEGYDVRLYDYARNLWVPAAEAMAGGRGSGVYELAVLKDRRGRAVRARIVPEGRGAFRVEAASAGEPAVWAAAGVLLAGAAPRALARAAEGRTGPLTAAELDAALATLERAGGEAADGAAEARRALRPLLEGGGDARGRGRGGGRGRA